MTTPLWSSGTLYPPGSLVQPITTPAPAGAAIPNPGLESGDANWTKGAGWTIVNDAGDAFAGSWYAEFDGAGPSEIEMAAGIAVAPGRVIIASAQFDQGASGAGDLSGTIKLNWYDGTATLISASPGTPITRGNDGTYQMATVTGTAPAGAATVKIAFECTRSSGSDVARVDSFSWNYVSAALPSGLVYRAVQASAGYSGEAEPAWPATLGVTVVDNEVTWEAVQATRVEWTAAPILESGTVEPDWPTTPGETVLDGTIIWECVSRRVEDENCPATTPTAILASKVFKADADIVRFSATANPLDWTTAQDAGYLPTGLQQANANDVAVLAPYRSNLCPMNASSFQNWQVDPDPAAMAILDQMDGIGSVWQKAACPVGNELLYLSQLGVRSVGIANAAENLAAGDVGQPIDPLVRAAMLDAATGDTIPLATYYPGAGQYWLAFAPASTAPDLTEITLWGDALGQGGPAIDSTEDFNAEIFDASTVEIIGYWPDEFAFTYPPPDDPDPVTPADYGEYVALGTAIPLATDTAAGSDYYALGGHADNLPDGQFLAAITVDGETFLAALNNPAAS